MHYTDDLTGNGNTTVVNSISCTVAQGMIVSLKFYKYGFTALHQLNFILGQKDGLTYLERNSPVLFCHHSAFKLNNGSIRSEKVYIYFASLAGALWKFVNALHLQAVLKRTGRKKSKTPSLFFPITSSTGPVV